MPGGAVEALGIGGRAGSADDLLGASAVGDTNPVPGPPDPDLKRSFHSLSRSLTLRDDSPPAWPVEPFQVLLPLPLLPVCVPLDPVLGDMGRGSSRRDEPRPTRLLAGGAGGATPCTGY